MIKNAKVSLAAVDRFMSSVSLAVDFTNQFDIAMDCLGDYIDYLHATGSSLRGTSAAMEDKTGTLAATIQQLSDQLQVPYQTAREPRNIDTEADKQNYNRQNVMSRLSRAKNIDQQLVNHIKTVNDAVETLEKLEDECRRMKEQLAEIKVMNYKYGMMANEGLGKVKEAVNKYIGVQIVYENARLR